MTQIKIGDTIVASTSIRPGNRSSRRERETEAVTELLKTLLGEEVSLEHTPAGAPILVGAGSLHVSISHSENRAVVALNPSMPVGIDTETMRPQLERVAEKFLNSDEWSKIVGIKQLLIAWCVKEACYKAVGIDGLDFRNDIIIETESIVNVRGVGYRYDIVEEEENFATVLVTMDI